MPRIRTHYDNLKVARTAPPEIINAAYRALSQKFHPDKNPGNPDSVRIMAIINASYEVLSDPRKRQLHDNWIARQEQKITEPLSTAPNRPLENPQPKQQTTSNGFFIRLLIHVIQYWFWYALAIVIILISVSDKTQTPRPGPKPYIAAPPPKPSWTRPNTSPNGYQWPTTSAYVMGYNQLYTDGLSSVTIDNSRNDSDVFVKLVTLDGPQAFPIRIFYIPANDRFTAKNIRSGTYDVRYRDLNTGALLRSEAFGLEETKMRDGTEYSEIEITLYKVLDGNMETYPLSEEDF